MATALPASASFGPVAAAGAIAGLPVGGGGRPTGDSVTGAVATLAAVGRGLMVGVGALMVATGSAGSCTSESWTENSGSGADAGVIAWSAASPRTDTYPGSVRVLKSADSGVQAEFTPYAGHVDIVNETPSSQISQFHT